MAQDKIRPQEKLAIPPKLAILLVFFCLGELGEGLNILEGVYLVDRGWNEGSVGLALSLVGLTALVIQPWAGDWVDKTTLDRRIFLVIASITTALSASAVLLVRAGNYTSDHVLIYSVKIIEGVAASFIVPCVSALALATFGPSRFDAVMAAIMLWGHIGSVCMTIITGAVAYFLYPNAKYCFLVVGAAALLASFFVPYMSQGDPLMGRGFHGKEVEMDEDGYRLESDVSSTVGDEDIVCEIPPEAASYLDTFTDTQISLLCFTGFFYQYVGIGMPQPGIPPPVRLTCFIYIRLYTLQVCRCKCCLSSRGTNGPRRRTKFA
jgi:MFS family permease